MPSPDEKTRLYKQIFLMLMRKKHRIELFPPRLHRSRAYNYILYSFAPHPCFPPSKNKFFYFFWTRNEFRENCIYCFNGRQRGTPWDLKRFLVLCIVIGVHRSCHNFFSFPNNDGDDFLANNLGFEYCTNVTLGNCMFLNFSLPPPHATIYI